MNREHRQHAIGACSLDWDQRRALTDTQRESLDEGAPRVPRHHRLTAEELNVHEQAIEEHLDRSSRHVPVPVQMLRIWTVSIPMPYPNAAITSLVVPIPRTLLIV
jgi:hypothetical protein